MIVMMVVYVSLLGTFFYAFARLVRSEHDIEVQDDEVSAL